MVSLLKILSLHVPDSTAFTKSNIDFRIQGEHILIDHVSLSRATRSACSARGR